MEQAAVVRNEFALHTLGLMHSQGLGTDKNGSKALTYFLKMSNNSKSKYSGLAYLYLNGNGVEKNITKALINFEKAAKLGDIESESNLGAMYYSDFPEIKKNLSKAIYHFEKAAKKNQFTSVYNLAIIYLRGESIKINMTCNELHLKLVQIVGKLKKEKFTSLSYEKLKQNDFMGSFLYANIAALTLEPNSHVNNAFLMKKFKKEIRCRFGLEKLCEIAFLFRDSFFNEEKSSFKLGNLLMNRVGHFKENFKLAYFFFNRSADNLPEARYGISFLYENGLGVKKDINEAILECDKIIKGIKQGKFQQKNYIPAYLAKFKLIFKKSSLYKLFSY